MAIKMNTTQTIDKASSALEGKCEATKKNLEKLMKQAGIEDGKKAKVHLPLVPGSKDDVQFVGINGVGFYFKRGTTAEMPEAAVKILKSTGHL